MRKLGLLFASLLLCGITAESQGPPPPPPFAWDDYGATISGPPGCTITGSAGFYSPAKNTWHTVTMMVKPWAGDEDAWALVAWDYCLTDASGNGSFVLQGTPPLSTQGWDVYFACMPPIQLTQVTPVFYVD